MFVPIACINMIGSRLGKDLRNIIERWGGKRDADRERAEDESCVV